MVFLWFNRSQYFLLLFVKGHANNSSHNTSFKGTDWLHLSGGIHISLKSHAHEGCQSGTCWPPVRSQSERPECVHPTAGADIFTSHTVHLYRTASTCTQYIHSHASTENTDAHCTAQWRNMTGPLISRRALHVHRADSLFSA